MVWPVGISFLLMIRRPQVSRDTVQPVAGFEACEGCGHVLRAALLSGGLLLEGA